MKKARKAFHNGKIFTGFSLFSVNQSIKIRPEKQKDTFYSEKL